MIQSLWKPALALVAFVTLVITATLIPWHRLLYSQHPAELISSERVRVTIDPPAVQSRIRKAAAVKDYGVKTGYNGSERKLYAQISYGTCLIAMQQLSTVLYQVDYYALNGANRVDCKHMKLNDLLGVPEGGV